MSISTQYQKNLDDAARGALLSVVANHPSTSVSDLRELVQDHPTLGGLTLAELLGSRTGNQPSNARGSTIRPSSAGPSAGKTNGKSSESVKPRASWDTRTEAGRVAFDRAVLESLSVLGGESVSAEQIRARLGATPAQVRTSLNRQIEGGDVSFSGKARGTRYSLEA